MLNRTLPATDLNVSSLCFGTTDVGGAVPAADAELLLDAFVAAGGVFIDTAAVYSNWRPGERSASEKTIGRWMKKRGNRRRLVIATKGAHPEMADMHAPRSSPAWPISTTACATCKPMSLTSISSTGTIALARWRRRWKRSTVR
jgi:aryl-alcohol dehydrogenase-like predicted oxidoreductase